MTTCAAALREAADLLDAHPHLPVPLVSGGLSDTVYLSWYYQTDPADRAAVVDPHITAAAVITALPGPWEPDGEHDLGGTYYVQQHGRLKLTVLGPVGTTLICEGDDCHLLTTDIAWSTGRSVCDDHGDQPHTPEPVPADERDL